MLRNKKEMSIEEKRKFGLKELKQEKKHNP